MSLLAPLFLAGIALVAGPIVFHLFQRSPKDRVVFSSTELLDPSPPKRKRRSTLENPFLLLLRCLIIALLCVAFARPFFSPENLPPDMNSMQRDVILLLDESASMSNQGKKALALMEIDQWIQDLDTNDRVAVVAFSDTAETVVSFEQWSAWTEDERPAMARSILERRPVHPRPSYLDLGLESAIQELETLRESQSDHGFGEIIVVSDFAEGSRTGGLAGLEWPNAASIHRIEIPNALSRQNVGLRWLGWSETEDLGTAVARIALAHSEIHEGFEATLTIDDPLAESSPLTERSVYIDGEAGQIVTFEFERDIADKPLRVTLQGDEQDFDNTLWVAPDFNPEFDIAVRTSHELSDTNAAPYFIRKALLGFGNPKVNILNWNAGDSIPFGHAFLIEGTLSANESSELKSSIEAGAFALLILSQDKQIPLLESLSGVPGWQLQDSSESDALLGRIDFNNAAFAPFSDSRFNNFTGIRFWNPQNLIVPSSLVINTIADFDNGQPALVELVIGEGRLLVWNHSWAPSDSQWVLSSKFVPWMHQFVMRATGGQPPPSNALLSESGLAPYHAYETWTQHEYSDKPLTRPSEPGLYELRRKGDKRWIAIQLDPTESLGAPLTEGFWIGIGLPETSERDHVMQRERFAANQRKENNLQAERRQKIWKWLIFATLALLGIESAIAISLNRGRELATA